MTDVKSWTRILIATTGAAMAGPAGAIIGTFLGSIVASVLPGSNDFTNQVFANLGKMSVEGLRHKLETRLTPQEKQRVNFDLQNALRDAVKEALLDVGGVECFPQLAISPRELPVEVVFALTAPGRTLWQRKNPLTLQVQECLQAIASAIDAQTIFPLNPIESQASASVETYLLTDTPEKLADQFFNENIQPVLNRFTTLVRELPELVSHLKKYMYERTLVHLGDLLKKRTSAWREFNRLILESLQGELTSLQAGQSEILDRINALISPTSGSGLDEWSDQMAEMLTATGAISKQMGEGFQELTDRVIDQHREIIFRLDDLVAVSARIEKKVDKVLRYIGEGQLSINSEQRTIPMPRPPAPGEVPFKGLQYFTENDAHLFFGRERWIARLVARLQGIRFLAVIGASGSGKSSIVRAGVIPVLKGTLDLREVEFRPANSPAWPVHIITPSAHPLESLAAALSSQNETNTLADFVAELRQDPHRLDLRLRAQAQAAHADHVLLVVDQFEEVFTQCQDPLERTAFIDCLMDAANPSVKGVLVLLLILRADFYGNCADYEQLRLALSQYQEYIGPMTADEIRRAIEEPARKLGWKFEPGLVDLIIQDAGQEPGMLPLLSHALLETWRNRSSHTMTLESYAESGGVKGAIAKTAEMVYSQRLSAEQQEMARAIFLRLSNLEEGSQATRRRSSLDELTTHTGKTGVISKVVNLLAEARLVTIEEGAVDVAHEALIREWPRLNGWIEDNRAGLKIHHRLAAAALEWQHFHQDEGLLYRGLRLQEANEWVAANPGLLNESEHVFLTASLDLEQREVNEKQAQQQRELEAAQKIAATESKRAEEQMLAARQLRRREYFLRLALFGAALLATAAIVFGILAANSSQQANASAQSAQIASTRAVAESFTRATAETNALNQSRVSQIREVAARARSMVDRNQDLSLLLAAEVIKLEQIYGNAALPEVQTSLFQTLTSANYATTLRGHTDALYSANFSPDGKKIVTSSQDSTAMVWGIDGRRLAVLTGHTAPLNGAVFSPDGTKIVTFSQDGTARLWQADGKLQKVLEGHTADVTQASFSRDGSHILTVSKDGSGRIWDGSGNNPIILKGHTDAVLSGVFSPDGTLIATAGADQTVRLWDLTGKLIKTLAGHSSWVVSVQFSQDSQKLVSASWDDTAKVWSREGMLLATLSGHASTLNYASFSPDGSQVVTGANDNTTKIWSVDGKLLADLKGHTQAVDMAVFSPDGAMIATASWDNTVRLWQSDGTPLAVLHGHAGSVESVNFSPDGSWLLTSGTDWTARLWQTNLQVQLYQDHYGAATTGGFSPDGSLFLTGSNDGYIRLHRKDGVKVLEFYTIGPIYRAVFSPDSKQILVGTTKPKGLIFNLAGEVVAELDGHTAAIVDARYSPDGSMIVTASKDGTAILWHPDGSIIAALKGHSAVLASARFSPDGKTVITASDDKTVRFWKTDGTPLPLILTLPDSVSSASFSPDGNRILISCWDSNAYIYRLDGTLLTRIQGHTGPVITAEYSPDGKLIVTSSWDATARVWDADGAFLTSLEGHISWLNSADFSPDGSHILTTSWDGTARMWYGYAKVSDMAADAIRRVGRSLNSLECKTYLYLDNCP